jgi:hypothetical protein
MGPSSRRALAAALDAFGDEPPVDGALTLGWDARAAYATHGRERRVFGRLASFWA